jgi:hypothetical protein
MGKRNAVVAPGAGAIALALEQAWCKRRGTSVVPATPAVIADSISPHLELSYRQP